MLVHRIYKTPSECKRVFKALSDQGLHRGGLLYQMYQAPEQWFDYDSVLVLRYDDRQRVLGALLTARGGGVRGSSLEEALKTHYGLVQAYVHEPYRRKGIARAMLGRLFETLPRERFIANHSLRVCAPLADRGRLTDFGKFAAAASLDKVATVRSRFIPIETVAHG